MGYYLLDNRNPNGDHFYPTRRGSLLAYVVHITAGLEDLDGVDDHSAENTARYAATTARQVSWHVGTDADSGLELLPPTYTAWHASDYNSRTYGHEISKRHTDWRTMPLLWTDRTLHQAARHAARIAVEYGIPIRHATRAELDKTITYGGRPVGFVGHYELDPGRRDDPGRLPGTAVDTFPWARFLDLVRHYATPAPTPAHQEDDTMEEIQLPAGDYVVRPISLDTLGGGSIVFPEGSRMWLRLFGFDPRPADQGGVGTGGALGQVHWLVFAGSNVAVDPFLVRSRQSVLLDVPDDTVAIELMYSSKLPLSASIVWRRP